MFRWLFFGQPVRWDNPRSWSTSVKQFQRDANARPWLKRWCLFPRLCWPAAVSQKLRVLFWCRAVSGYAVPALCCGYWDAAPGTEPLWEKRKPQTNRLFWTRMCVSKSGHFISARRPIPNRPALEKPLRSFHLKSTWRFPSKLNFRVRNENVLKTGASKTNESRHKLISLSARENRAPC